MKEDIFSKTILPELKRSTAEKFGKENGELIHQEACKNLADFIRTADYRKDRAVKLHLQMVILPGLAYYRALLASGIPKEDAYKHVSAELARFSEKQRDRLKTIKNLLFLYPIFRWMAKAIISLGFPPAGWDLAWVRNDRREIAFTMTSCVYCDVLKMHAAFELAPVFCEGDQVTYGGLEPVILFRRTETLAGGGKCCDFRYINNRVRS